jgi:hypothetical protein
MTRTPGFEETKRCACGYTCITGRSRHFFVSAGNGGDIVLRGLLACLTRAILTPPVREGDSG